MIKIEETGRIEGFCYIYLNKFDPVKESVVIIYPEKLKNQKVLQENICKVSDYIYDYILAVNEYEIQTAMIRQAIFDIEKLHFSSLADKTQKLIDDLSEELNGNLSPYRWNIQKDVNGYIADTYVKADYACVLENI